MINQQTILGNWNEIKGKLQSKWGSLTDDDLTVFNGNVDQLLGAIQKKTGAARDSIEHFLGQITSGGAAAISGVGDSARAGAQQAMESIQASSGTAAAAVREGYADVEAMVRKRPAESLLACFGVGLVTGVVVSLLLQRK
ncbi:MAG: CsbD family protein [Planctomycetota bacterium]|nr:MAG: CsbD family protein [Planctomycetota bacterium]